jgi:hypothetical protein
MVLQLSKHFCDQWRNYFKQEPPSVTQIFRIISQSVWLQKCCLLYDADGIQHKQLATYWHPDRKLVIKVDWLENKVVTVITPMTRRKRKPTST